MSIVFAKILFFFWTKTAKRRVFAHPVCLMKNDGSAVDMRSPGLAGLFIPAAPEEDQKEGGCDGDN